MTEKIVSKEEFRSQVKAGIDILADAVRDTMGPMGNTVVIKDPFGQIKITKDGVSVAKEIDLADPVQSIGSELVKEVALKANNLAGDGTTAATVLAQAIYAQGNKHISLGENALDFKRGLNSALVDVLKIVKKNKFDLTTESPELKQVAMVSSNGDEAVSETVTKVFKELGVNAVVSVVLGDGIETTVNIVKGMQFDRGYLSPYCITDPVKMKAEYSDPLILLYDGKISEFREIGGALEYAVGQGKPLIIVAEDVQDSALRGLVQNRMQGQIKSAVVVSPGYGNKRSERLHDMAFLFGGEVMSKESNMKTSFNPDCLGTCERAEITRKDSAFIGGNGLESVIQERIDFINQQITQFEGNKYETDILKERLGKLSGGVAMIKVGAYSTEEAQELLDRVEDCKHAVRAALEEGIVEGGGFALLNASVQLRAKALKPDLPSGIKAGYLSLLEAIQAPMKRILLNGNIIPEVILKSLSDEARGYDVKKGIFLKDMVSGGIIDPFKVTRISLESAVSIVGTLLTSNYAIVAKDDITTTNFS